MSFTRKRTLTFILRFLYSIRIIDKYPNWEHLYTHCWDFFASIHCLMLENRIIDHIVYAVPDLEQAMQDFESKTGVAPAFGGYHTHQGTKNAIVNIGQEAYLEIITVDPANEAISGPRWMGVDLIQEPKVTRWSLKSDQLSSDSAILHTYDSRMGEIKGGQRNTSSGDLLSWMMIMPLPDPEIEIVPFITSWGTDSTHPTSNLRQECSLLGIQFTHPQPELVLDVWQGLGLRESIDRGAVAQIKLVLDTPKGRVEL